MEKKYEIVRESNFKMLFGVKNSYGDWIIPAEFEFITGLHENSVWIKDDGRWKRIIINGQVLVELEAGINIYEFNDILARFKKNGKQGLIDIKGNIVLQAKYDQVENSYDGIAFVLKNKYWSVFDEETGRLWEIKIERFIELEQNVFYVKKDKKWFRLIEQNRFGEAFPFEEIEYFDTENYAFFKYKCNGKWGIIDSKLNIICPAKFLELDKGIHGIPAAAKNDEDKYGFVDIEGNTIVPFKYDWCNSFFGGVGIVEINDKMGVVNINGEYVIELIYDLIIDEFIHLYVQKDGYFWYIDYKGKRIKNMPKDKLENFDNYY